MMSEKKKRLVVFDLDGTLLDTIADLAAATNFALASLGYPTHDIDEIRGYVGNGIGKLLERALPRNSRNSDTLEKIRHVFVSYYDEHNADLSKPYPGVCDMLERLQTEGLMLAVASNKYQAATEKLVARYFPDIRFIAIFGQRTGVPVKPDPQIVFDIVSQAGVSLEEVVYVGDSGVDMHTARHAGVDAIGVAWGFRPRTELEEEHPLAVADEAGNVVDMVLAMMDRSYESQKKNKKNK